MGLFCVKMIKSLRAKQKVGVCAYPCVREKKTSNLSLGLVGLGHVVLVAGLHARLQGHHLLLASAQLGAQARLRVGHLRLLSRQLLQMGTHRCEENYYSIVKN